MEIKIFTDTASDITFKEMQIYNVNKIELPVHFDGDANPITSDEEFWKKLIDGKVSRTSQPSPSQFYNEFVKAKEGNYAILLITISSKLSGTYSSAVAMKETVGYEHIYIVDSLSATIAEKLLVFEACKYRDLNLPIDEIITKLETFKTKIRLFACIDSLKYLARGGRISKTTASIGTLVNIKPIVTILDGHVQSHSKAIGITRGSNKIIEIIQSENINTDYKISPVFAYDDTYSKNLTKKLIDLGFDVDVLATQGIGPVIGTHIGPQGFGIIYVVK